MPRSWRRIGASTSRPQTTPSTSTTSCSRRTRCTPRSAPVRSWVGGTPSCRARRSIRAAEPSRSSRRPTCTGQACPTARKPGSPNVVGAVAMAAAAQALMDAGMDDIARHEAALTAYALERLQAVPGVTVYGAGDAGAHWTIASASSPSTSDRCLTRWWRRSSATRRGSACGAAASARNPMWRTCSGAAAERPDAGSRTPGGATSGQAWHGPAQSRRLQHARRYRRARRHVGAHRSTRLSWDLLPRPDSGDYSPAGYHETILDYRPRLSGEP